MLQIKLLMCDNQLCILQVTFKSMPKGRCSIFGVRADRDKHESRQATITPPEKTSLLPKSVHQPRTQHVNYNIKNT